MTSPKPYPRLLAKLDATASGRYFLEFIAFTYKNAASCLFPGFIFILLAFSNVVSLPIPRYDFLLLGCLAMQLFMVVARLETLDELKVIGVFHLLGLALELFKTYQGSWSYPEDAYSKLGAVPLYSGFMYASVASFMTQAWRRLDLQLVNWASPKLVVPLGVAIYLNFFTHHFTVDLRWWLVAAVLIVFIRTRIRFTPYRKTFAMPLALAFFLIGIFVWFAENISTYLGAWVYPHQTEGWQVVELSKLGSWGLLVIVSFMIVAQLKRVKARTASR